MYQNCLVGISTKLCLVTAIVTYILVLPYTCNSSPTLEDVHNLRIKANFLLKIATVNGY